MATIYKLFSSYFFPCHLYMLMVHICLFCQTFSLYSCILLFKNWKYTFVSYCNRFVYFQIVLRDARPVQLQSCQCTCVAGTALCNHVAALLYQTAHFCQLRINSVPPTHSCTDTEQKWHKPRTMVTNVSNGVLWLYLWICGFIDNLFV